MVKEKKQYLMDSDSLMTAARLFYAYDLAPSFWATLEDRIKAGNIVLLDMVKAEIDKGNDKLKSWVSERQGEFVLCNHVDPEIISVYAQIMQYIQTCGFYNEKGLNEWARNDIADPWIIATAAVKGFKVVTFEAPTANLSPKNKTGRVKISDVAKHFDVTVCNLYNMMRELAIQI